MRPCSHKILKQQYQNVQVHSSWILHVHKHYDNVHLPEQASKTTLEQHEIPVLRIDPDDFDRNTLAKSLAKLLQFVEAREVVEEIQNIDSVRSFKNTLNQQLSYLQIPDANIVPEKIALNLANSIHQSESDKQLVQQIASTTSPQIEHAFCNAYSKIITQHTSSQKKTLSKQIAKDLEDLQKENGDQEVNLVCAMLKKISQQAAENYKHETITSEATQALVAYLCTERATSECNTLVNNFAHKYDSEVPSHEHFLVSYSVPLQRLSDFKNSENPVLYSLTIRFKGENATCERRTSVLQSQPGQYTVIQSFDKVYGIRAWLRGEAKQSSFGGKCLTYEGAYLFLASMLTIGTATAQGHADASHKVVFGTPFDHDRSNSQVEYIFSSVPFKMETFNAKWNELLKNVKEN